MTKQMYPVEGGSAYVNTDIFDVVVAVNNCVYGWSVDGAYFKFEVKDGQPKTSASFYRKGKKRKSVSMKWDSAFKK